MNGVSNVGFTDYNAEQEAIDRRLKLAQALQAQGAAPVEMPQTAPGGFTPHMSWTQGLAKIIQSYTGARGVRQAEDQRRQLANQYQSDVSGDVQALAKALGGRQAQTIQPDPQEAQQSADYGTPQVGSVNLPAQTPSEALQSALPNMRTPVGQQMATAYLTNSIASPEKFGHTPVTMMGQDGKPVQVLVGDKGTVRPVTGFGVAPKLHFADTGSAIQPVNETTGETVGGPIAKNMTPGETANLGFKMFAFNNLDANQKANLGVELKRLGISEQQLAEGRVQLMQDNDGNVFAVNKVTRTGAPVGQEGGGQLRINKPMTESQANANIFGTRAEASHKILNDLEEKISTTGLAAKRGLENIPLVGGAVGAVANTALSPNQQKVEQAQRDFVNAVLRKESGASISPSEFQNAIRQYFPQPGDSPAVIAQKRANRQLEISGLMAAAGKAPNQGASPVVSNPQANQPFASPQVKTISWNDLK